MDYVQAAPQMVHGILFVWIFGVSFQVVGVADWLIFTYISAILDNIFDQ